MTEATIIIAAWNAESTLARCVQSAVMQDDVMCEIIIVDDVSTDGTHAIAQSLAADHPNLRVLQMPQNAGPAAARNAGLAAARGDWVAVLDADDAFGAGRLRGLIDFAADTKADIVCDGMIICDETGAQTAPPPLLFRGDPSAEAWTLADYIYGNQVKAGTFSLGYLKPVFRRAFLADQSLRYNEALHNGEDFHFVLAALGRSAQMRYLPEPGYLYTVHAGSISHRMNLDHAQNLMRADAAFLDAHNAEMSPEATTLMQARLRDIADLTAVETVMRALKQRDVVTAGKVLLQRPRTFGKLCVQLGEALRKRVGRA